MPIRPTFAESTLARLQTVTEESNALKNYQASKRGAGYSGRRSCSKFTYAHPRAQVVFIRYGVLGDTSQRQYSLNKSWPLVLS
jgi:hypothetical protein